MMTPEWMPYLQFLGVCMVFIGVCITLATVVFYGGRIVQKVESAVLRIDNIELVLFSPEGTVKKTNDNDYHIKNVCGKIQRRA